MCDVIWRHYISAALLHPSASRTPSRCAVYRRKRREEEDRRVLSMAEKSTQRKPDDPCYICGLSRHLDSGHALYREEFFCCWRTDPVDTQQSSASKSVSPKRSKFPKRHCGGKGDKNLRATNKEELTN